MSYLSLCKKVQFYNHHFDVYSQSVMLVHSVGLFIEMHRKSLIREHKVDLVYDSSSGPFGSETE